MATAVIVITDDDDGAGVSVRTTFNKEQDMSASLDPMSIAHDMAFKISNKMYSFHEKSVIIPNGTTIH